MSRKKLIIVLLLICVSTLKAQNEFKDFFVYKNGDTIKCNITKAKNQKIFFSLPKNNEGSAYFYECQDIFLSPESKSELALNYLEKPKDGYAHIYIYKPYVGIEPLGSFIIKEGEKKLVNIKTNSSFLIKVKTGTKHTYSTKMNLFNKDEITILAENKKIYYIRASTQCNETGANNQSTLCGRNISLNDDIHSELQILTMYKKPKIY